MSPNEPFALDSLVVSDRRSGKKGQRRSQPSCTLCPLALRGPQWAPEFRADLNPFPIAIFPHQHKGLDPGCRDVDSPSYGGSHLLSPKRSGGKWQTKAYIRFPN